MYSNLTPLQFEHLKKRLLASAWDSVSDSDSDPDPQRPSPPPTQCPASSNASPPQPPSLDAPPQPPHALRPCNRQRTEDKGSEADDEDQTSEDGQDEEESKDGEEDKESEGEGEEGESEVEGPPPHTQAGPSQTTTKWIDVFENKESLVDTDDRSSNIECKITFRSRHLTSKLTHQAESQEGRKWNREQLFYVVRVGYNPGVHKGYAYAKRNLGISGNAEMYAFLTLLTAGEAFRRMKKDGDVFTVM